MTIDNQTLPDEEAGLCCIIPPYVLDHLSQSRDPRVRQLAIDAIKNASSVRAVRATLAMMPGFAAVPSPTAKRHRLVYDVKNGDFADLPGRCRWIVSRILGGESTSLLSRIAYRWFPRHI